VTQTKADSPTLFMLHALGGSALAFDSVRKCLGFETDIVAVDFPGFGSRSTYQGTTVEDMSNFVIDVIRAHAPTRWIIVGHSMGGKIATVIASRAMKGEPGLFGLVGVVLLAGSPPSPEPMDDAKRDQMISWVSAGPLDDEAAQTFVDANVGAPLPPDQLDRAISDLKRCSPHAWRAWLERGSREDWSIEVGTLQLPTLVIVGSEDGDLGVTGQRATNMQVYPRAELLTFEGAGHLLPLERSEEVAHAIDRFSRCIVDHAPVVPEGTARLIATPRVSSRTRAILAQRALSDLPVSRPQRLSDAQLATLQAISARVVPQASSGIDLAARLDAYLAEGGSDGWRFADMPGDVEAYGAALDALSGFEALDRPSQRDCLDAIAAGTHRVKHSNLTSEQLKLWFEDARSDLVRLWLSHPATAARIGFHGFANGGDGKRLQGFDELAAGKRDHWEPER
jgi:pimeloyl-ACP methyl ester carboxylesterase